MTLRDDYEHWARGFARRMGEGWGEFLDRIGVFELTDSPPGNTTIGPTNSIVLVDATAKPYRITPTGPAGVLHMIKKVDSSANAVTIIGTIDGDVNFALEFQDESASITSDGTDWWIV